MVNVKTEKEPLLAEAHRIEDRATRAVSFCFAHLSDLHLTSLYDIKIPQLFSKRVLGYFSWLHKRRVVHRREIIDSLLEDLQSVTPDHITITGDLTHLGLPMEYAEVKQWLPLLGSPEQVTVIPGNHEAYSGRDWSKLCSMWGPYLESDTNQETPKTAGFFPSLRIRDQLAFIGLCSATPTLPLLATGSLGQKQLSDLEFLLEEIKGKDLMRVVLVHHPPTPGTVKWRKRLTDLSQLSSILARYHIHLVLHGHAHAPAITELRTLAGTIPVIGAPSASELNPWTGNHARYNLYHVNRVGQSWELIMSVRGYSEDLGRFVAEEERVLSVT